MRTIFLTAFLALSAAAVAGPILLQPQDKNLADEQGEVSRFLDDLARGKNTGAAGGRQVSYADGASGSSNGGYHGALDFKAAGKSAYQTNQTLDAMTALSMAGLKAMGTAAQGDMASRLSDYGQQLSQSGSPALAQAGGNLQDQAAAMNAGDTAGAQSASQSLQSISRMSLPAGYIASYADQTWGDAMKTVGTDFMSSFASSAGQAAVSALASSLTSYFTKGSQTGTSGSSGFWASMFGSLGGKVGQGIVTGTNSPSNIADASKGIANQAGGVLGQQAGTGGASTQSGGLPTLSGSSLPGAAASSGSGLNTVINASGGGSAAGSALPGSK